MNYLCKIVFRSYIQGIRFGDLLSKIGDVFFWEVSMGIYLRGISSGDWGCGALRSYFRGIFVGNDFRSSVSFGK